MARPSKYTPEMEKKIVEALTAGVSRKTAAEYAGIDEKTVINWMKRYSSFSSAVIAAETKVEVSATISLRQAWASGDWRAALAWLERRRHEDWGRKDRLEIIQSVRELARANGKDEEAAVAEAEAILKEIRGAGRR
jgi:transposase